MKKRIEVYNKYNGKCAYTGTDLKSDWQIDHIVPLRKKIQSFNELKSHNDINNLVPCQWIVNHYKRGFDLEGFRVYMNTFNVRLSKLPKKPKTDKSLRRVKYMVSIAKLFKITPDNPFNGKFYFELLTETKHD